jgi:hypothetical protein
MTKTRTDGYALYCVLDCALKVSHDILEITADEHREMRRLRDWLGDMQGEIDVIGRVPGDPSL